MHELYCIVVVGCLLTFWWKCLIKPSMRGNQRLESGNYTCRWEGCKGKISREAYLKGKRSCYDCENPTYGGIQH